MKEVTTRDILAAKILYGPQEAGENASKEERMQAIAKRELKLSFPTKGEFFRFKKIAENQKVLSWADAKTKTVMLQFPSIAEKKVFEGMARQFGTVK